MAKQCVVCSGPMPCIDLDGVCDACHQRCREANEAQDAEEAEAEDVELTDAERAASSAAVATRLIPSGSPVQMKPIEPDPIPNLQTQAHEWAMRWYFGGGVEAGLDVYCDRQYQTRPQVRQLIDSYAAFAEQVAREVKRGAGLDAIHRRRSLLYQLRRISLLTLDEPFPTDPVWNIDEFEKRIVEFVKDRDNTQRSLKVSVREHEATKEHLIRVSGERVELAEESARLVTENARLRGEMATYSTRYDQLKANVDDAFQLAASVGILNKTLREIVNIAHDRGLLHISAEEREDAARAKYDALSVEMEAMKTALTLVRGERDVARAVANVDESQRRMLLLAMAELSLRRPGWLNALGLVAEQFHGVDMFNEFRQTSAGLCGDKV